MNATVHDVPDRSRYEISLDDKSVGFTEYRVYGEVVLMAHTVISPEFRGQGLADQLIRYALDDVRSHGRTVSPVCPYVAAFIEAHPEYADLVAR